MLKDFRSKIQQQPGSPSLCSPGSEPSSPPLSCSIFSPPSFGLRNRFLPLRGETHHQWLLAVLLTSALDLLPTTVDVFSSFMTTSTCQQILQTEGKPIYLWKGVSSTPRDHSYIPAALTVFNAKVMPWLLFGDLIWQSAFSTETEQVQASFPLR